MKKFNDFEWHDALIKNIQINRTNPGVNDTIVFDIEWPKETAVVTFIFEDVYWAVMRLNFGIIAPESILMAMALVDDQDLSDFYSKTKWMTSGLKLSMYRIEVNSTAGEIKIIANSFRVERK